MKTNAEHNPKGNFISQFFSKLFKEYIMYVLLVVLIVFFAVNKSSFLSLANLLLIINQNVYLIVIGVGITMIMLAGALDLSIGYQVSIVSVVMGLMAQSGKSTPVVILTGIALAVVLSTINGVIYARLKVFPFIITLATQYMFYGASYLLSESKSFRSFDDAFCFLGKTKFAFTLAGKTINFPLGILVMCVIVAIGAFILNRTYFGRNIYALGSNPDAVKLSGVNVAAMRVKVFALAGVFFALGSILIIGRTGSSSSSTGQGAEFAVMAGAMLGGIKMGGGGGKMNNMVLGILIIGVLNNGMTLMNWGEYWQNVAMGGALLLAITLDTLQTERVIKRAKMVAGTPPTENPTSGCKE